jgi:hypothetical protein
MADFQLELDVFASTAKLEKGLKRAEQAVTRSSQKMDAELKKIDGGESAGSKDRRGVQRQRSSVQSVPVLLQPAWNRCSSDKAAEAMKPGGSAKTACGVGYAW